MSAGARHRPRLGFVGLGWIGALRLQAVLDSGAAEVAALCDADAERLRAWGERCPRASRYDDALALIDGAADDRLHGLVLATPNALHAPHAAAALDDGLSLFVQKPLGLSAAEVSDVIERARRADRLVAVDYSYRHLEGARALRERVRDGALGQIHLVEAVFHNAYGPDKAWCFDPARSGGGALLDLGVHHLDLVFWIFGSARVRALTGRVHELADAPGIDVFTAADMLLERDLHLRLTCSWHAHAGRDCDFRLTVHGTEGGAELRSIGGSFYDFELVVRRGRSEEAVATDSRSWMDRGILSWVERVGAGERFDDTLETSLSVARVVERIYADARAASATEVPETGAAADIHPPSPVPNAALS